VSTGAKIEIPPKTKIKKNMKTIIEAYHNGYFITKFAFKKERRASKAINN